MSGRFRLGRARILAAWALAICAASPLFAGERSHSRDESLFSVTEYMSHLERLASDEMEGRGTGQPGIDRAAEYIADHFRKLGVAPAGDNGTYFQTFTLQLEHEIGSGTRLAVGTNGRRADRTLSLRKDYVPLAFSTSAEFDSNVVFAGYGIVNEDEGWDDYKGVDVEGKVVLVIRRAPSFGAFSVARDQTFMAKAALARERKAAAMLIVNNTDDEGLYEFEGRGRVRSYEIPMLHVTREAADELMKAGGLRGLAEMQQQIEQTQKPASAPLAGVRVAGAVDVRPIDSPARNVVGMIPGSGPQKDEIIVLGGHYDHLGIRNKGKPDFDPETDISNGADDNASGTALVMQMAKAYTQGARPNRSILMILFSAEEIGLLGSAHYTSHPTVDLEKCVAMFNFDMVGRLKDDRLEVGGMRTGGFEAMVHELAETYGLQIRDGGGGRGPSDHTHFYNKGIPVMFFFTGIHRQYHRPEDDVHLINSDGAIRIARFAADLIDRIDSSSARPVFTADTRRAEIGRQRDDDAARPQPSPAQAPTGVRLGVTPGDTDEPGVLVAEVMPDSPAAKAGLKPGDRIVRINRDRINSIEDAVAALAKLSEGDSANLGIFREGERMRLRVQFGEPRRAADEPSPRRPREGQGRPGDRPQPTERPGQAARRPAAVLAEAVEGYVARMKSDDMFKPYATGSSFAMDDEGGEITLHYRGERLRERAHELAHTICEQFEALAEKHPDLIGEFRIELSVQFRSTGSRDALHAVIEFDRARGAQRGGRPPRAAAADASGGALRARPDGPAREAVAARTDPHATGAAPEKVDDTTEVRDMPPVRLGIMPTYGDSDGEGYEIAGVVEGGAAARAGMKDNDRILLIGTTTVSNVYQYMEALRKYKPGDVVPVTVLRDGRRVELKVKAEGPMVREAA